MECPVAYNNKHNTHKMIDNKITGELDDELTNLTNRHARKLDGKDEKPMEIITSALKDVEEITETISNGLKR